MSRFAKAFFVSTFLIGLFGLIVFSTASTEANKSQHWITVDASELSYIIAERGRRDPAGIGSIGVAHRVGSIAILPLNDIQMEELSRSMHDTYHKCSGYVAHTTEAEAIEWTKSFVGVDNNAVFATYSINNPTSVSFMHSSVSEPRIRQTITDLSAFPNRRYNQPSGLQSATWIKDKWSAMAAGLNRGDVTVDFYNHPTATSPQPSVIMTFRGTTFPDEIVVIGAHQDSINSSGATAAAPGADDDASGVATMTEAIQVMINSGFKPERTVQFMAYAAEEVGLRGSAAIATEYRNQNKNVIGVMQLDMTNFRGSQGFDIVLITDLTNAAQNQFLRDLISTYQPGLVTGNSTCGYGCSDHASWNTRNYPASFPFEAPFNNSNNAIHTANDTLARSNSNANHAVNFAKLALSFVAELAKGCTIAGARCVNV